ncbi:MAG: FAD-binding oxidoreductase, partial [Deltaproteobacteria bacterium]|nr:FAD-binding oxidoreductase [Deltaproteobacteria bacterium]
MGAVLFMFCGASIILLKILAQLHGCFDPTGRDSDNQYMSNENEFLETIRPYSNRLLTSPEDRLNFGSDWTRLPSDPLAIAFPSTASDVCQILKACLQYKVAVVPSGGRTGLCGGAVAGNKELVLNLGRLNAIGAVDGANRSIRVQAGALNENVQQVCSQNQLQWPIDLASKGSCMIGGNLATNAGGLRVIRYGMARRWVSALQIATMGGSLIELNHGLEKNNTGFDLLQLMIGSEGTLAVITEATLKLAPKPKESTVLLCALESLADLMRVLEKCRSAPFEIQAFEFFSQKCLNAVVNKLHT